MKNSILLILSLVLITPVFAQDEEDNSEIKTIFKSETKVDGFGAFDMNFTSINGSYAMLLGGHGGLIINRKFLLGLGGYGVATPLKFQGIDPVANLELRGGYGGIITGVILAPREVFHASFPIFVGIGGMEVAETDFIFDPDNPFLDNTVESSVMVVVEPGAQLEVNITRFFRMAIGISYRFTEGVNLSMNNIDDSDISGLSGRLSFMFGGF